jgi:hypothetical protein
MRQSDEAIIQYLVSLIAAQYALAVPTSATRRKISLDKSVQAPGKVLI